MNHLTTLNIVCLVQVILSVVLLGAGLGFTDQALELKRPNTAPGCICYLVGIGFAICTMILFSVH